MSSELIFKAPYPVAQPPAVPFFPVVSAQEANGLHGKLRAIKTLFLNPRAQLPELEQYIVQLYQCQNCIYYGRKVPYSVEYRVVIEFTIETMKLLEDLIVRVIVKREDIQEVWDSQAAMLRRLGVLVSPIPPPQRAPK